MNKRVYSSVVRRSRFRRESTGKNLHLGDRDKDILQWLYRYRYLRQDQLTRLVQPKSEKRFVERLGDLFHETGFINRPNIMPDGFDARSTPMLYEISNAGVAYLETLGELPPRAVTFSRRSCRSYNPQFAHTMMIIEALMGVELETMREEGQRFVPVDEILARAPEDVRNARNPLSVSVIVFPSREHPVIRSRLETHVIPDALYGIEYLIDGEKRYRFWALECEGTSPSSRTTTKASSRALKLAAYDALIKSKVFKQRWGIPNLKLQFYSKTKGLETI